MAEEKVYSELKFAVSQVGEGVNRRYQFYINAGMVRVEWNADDFDKFWETYKSQFEDGILIYLPTPLIPLEG